MIKTKRLHLSKFETVHFLFFFMYLSQKIKYLLYQWSHSVVSDSLRPHGLSPTRLLCPWDFPGNSTGVDCHFRLQRIFPTQGSTGAVIFAYNVLNASINLRTCYSCLLLLGFPGGSNGKESACNTGDLGPIPGLGRSPGERKGYPLPYSGLENSMDAIVHGVSKCQTWATFTFTLKESDIW